MKKATGRNRETAAVIVTENNLLKGFTTKGIRNYDQKQSGKLESDVRWRCGSTGQESFTE